MARVDGVAIDLPDPFRKDCFRGEYLLKEDKQTESQNRELRIFN